MASKSLRVVSLLPSATECLCTIGGESLLVGRSHECDFPPSIVKNNIPILTSQKTRFTSAKDVDDQVRTALSQGESLYDVDEALLKKLQPDVILTQQLCSVCSIDLDAVNRIVASMENPQPRIVSLNPHSLEEVLDALLVVGDAVGMTDEAKGVRESLQQRVEAAVSKVAQRKNKSKNVAFIEWSDPIYVGGHWTPELIEMAGGVQGVNPAKGVKSFAITHQQLVESNPDKIIVCPCGLDLKATEQMVREMELTEWWRQLRAVKSGNVSLVDGNQMFNRPGPRLVECLEWLCEWMPLNGNAEHRGDHLENKSGILWDGSFPWKAYEFDATNQANVQQVKQQLDDEWIAIEEAHQAAMKQGKKLYIDPKTGYSVFTAQAAIDRGYCCGRGCRHCPYGHFNCESQSRKSTQASTIRVPTLMRQVQTPKQLKAWESSQPDRIFVLFWSGGKDSFLTYLTLKRDGFLGPNDRIVFFNTFDPDNGMVPEQQVQVSSVMDQSKQLKEDLMVVPLAASSVNTSYVSSVEQALQKLADSYHVEPRRLTLVFGDLHLADIRDWRASSFPDYECIFPLFDVPYETLAAKLFAEENVHVTISAVRGDIDALRVGETFDSKLFDKIKHSTQPGGLDAFGENGEFHTLVTIQPK